jgi:hypothetical protein
MANYTNTELEAKVQALLAEGKSLGEALAIIMKEAEASKPAGYGARRDTIGYLSTSNDLYDIKRLKNIAKAKISKSKNLPDSIARYKKEIEAADKRINELTRIINSADEPWKKAMEFNEPAKSAFTYYLNSLKDKVDAECDKLTKGWTRAQVKAALLNITPVIPEESPEELKPIWKERIEHQDMLVITVARKISLTKKLSK